MTGTTSGTPREQWIDALRGINISLVVVAHVTWNPGPLRYVLDFALPLFFLIAGWLHRDSLSQSQCLRKSAAGLLVPYVCYLVILWPLEMLAAFGDRDWDAHFILTQFLKPMLLGGPLLKGFCAAFWFITCLFLTKQLVHAMVRRYPPRVCTAICAALLLAAWVHAWLLPQRWFPWNLHTVLFVAPFYYLGYRLRQADTAWLHPRHAPLFVLLAAAGVGLNLLGLHNELDLKYLDYGLPVATAVSAVAWCALLAMLARRYAFSGAGGLFAAVGTASITIMFTHQIIQLTLARQLGLENAVFRIVAAILLGWLLHALLSRSDVLRTLFIGPRSSGATPARPTLASASA